MTNYLISCIISTIRKKLDNERKRLDKVVFIRWQKLRCSYIILYIHSDDNKYFDFALNKYALVPIFLLQKALTKMPRFLFIYALWFVVLKSLMPHI